MVYAMLFFATEIQFYVFAYQLAVAIGFSHANVVKSALLELDGKEQCAQFHRLEVVDVDTHLE